MQSFEIGLSGLDAAQKALNTIGNNLANAATEGYHRETVQLAPARPTSDGRLSWGTGVDVQSVTRSIDTLVEAEILGQNGVSGQNAEELSVLQNIESTFGDLTSDSSLSHSIDEFFNALQDLSAHPSESTYQRQFITAAQSMANQFKTIGASLDDMSKRVDLQVDEAVTQVNALAAEIATLNEKIQNSEIGGSVANNLRDLRDQQISKLSQLVAVQTRQQDHGMVNVTAGGIALVIGADVTELETGQVNADTLGIGTVGSSTHKTLEGGKLGGLLSVKNDILTGIQDQLDTLAGTLVHQFNAYHVQGIGSAGSFSDLTGWNVDNTSPLEDLGVTDGTLNIRVTNTGTGQVQRVQIAVDASADTLEDIATRISAVTLQDSTTTPLNASVLSGRLHIGADSGYQFDFLPAPLPEPDSTHFAVSADAPSIAVSGIFTGAENDTLTFTVSGSGSVGNGDLSITVTNQEHDPITVLNVGSGYMAGKTLDLGNGIKISLGVGDLSAGDTFTVKALADTDMSGLLAAVGVNAFFSGSGAEDMAVLSGFDDSPGRVATALGSDHADNTNVKHMTSLQDKALDDLGGLTIGNYYNTLVTTIGQDITTTQGRQDNVEAMLQNLKTRQSDASGVDVNDQAAQILMYEQMYQAMGKFINSVQTSMDTLMSLVG